MPVMFWSVEIGLDFCICSETLPKIWKKNNNLKEAKRFRDAFLKKMP